MHEEIQQQGAWAARHGLSLFECPYLRVPTTAEHTAQFNSEWQEYVEAWKKGWRDEVEGWILGTRIAPVTGRLHAVH